MQIRVKWTALLVVAGLGVFLAFAPAAEAANLGKALEGEDNAAVKNYRKSVEGEGALTEKMLSDCIVLHREITDVTAKAKEMRPEVDQVVQQVEQLGAELNQTRETINRGDEEAVVAYNKKLDLYNQRSIEMSKLIEQYNGEVEVYEKKAEQFNTQCKDQPYYQEDYDKVEKELGYGI